jgi:hypothetical protein
VAAYSKPVSRLQRTNRKISFGFLIDRFSQLRAGTIISWLSRGGGRFRSSMPQPISGEKALKKHQESPRRGPKLSVMGRHYELPRSRPVRVAIGGLLVLFGFLGFLPVLGFWMIPLGLLVLSYEFHVIRRLRRRLIVRWERRKARKTAGKNGASKGGPRLSDRSRP